MPTSAASTSPQQAPAQQASNTRKIERGAGRVHPIGIVAMMLYLILFCIFLLIGLVELWPPPTAPDTPPQLVAPVTFLFWTAVISNEVRLFLIVAMAGALGSLVHALRSLFWYVGNRRLVVSWLAMYIMLPFVGMTLALIFYFVIRGGFFSPQATVQETSPFGFAAVAGLIGMFSPQAVLKLKQVAETVLAKPAEGKESVPQEPEPVVIATLPIALDGEQGKPEQKAELTTEAPASTIEATSSGHGA